MSRFASLAVLCLFAPAARAEEWKSAATWKGHGQFMAPQMAFTGDGKTLYLVSTTSVKSFDVTSGKEGASLKHRTAVTALHVSEDGKTVTTLMRDGSLCVWDPAAAKTRAVVRLRVGTVGCASFSPTGKALAVFGSAGASFRGNAVSLWQVPSGKALGQVIGDAANPQELRLSADGKRLAVVVDSFHMEKNDIICLPTLDVRLWDVPRRKLARTVMKAGLPRFASDGKSLAVLTLDGKGGGGQLVDPATGKAKAQFGGHKDGTRAVDFAPKILATGGQDHLVKVWDPATGKETASLAGHTAAVVAVVCSPDGKVIASASDDRTVRLWTLKE